MTSSELEAIVMHSGRLEVLCCLLDNGPLMLQQLGARTGRPLSILNRWIKALEGAGLLAKTTGASGLGAIYTATLDGHPDWVREAIDRHREQW